jgi:mannosyltransferase OCH1-like enzyme
MIPKIIHYCWFGGKEKPEDVLKMIASWKKHCPDYEIKEWNETNFDIHLNRYTEEAYQQKKWAFVSDVARLWALVHEGGIYMDTDVEVIRSLDNLLANKAFIGFEGTQWIGTNLMGTEPHNAFLQAFLEDYNHRNFTNPDGTLNQTTNVEEITSRFLTQHNLVRNGEQQQVGDFTVYPTDYFSPYDYINGKVRTTANTYSIHWFSQSWIKRSKWKTRLSQWWHRICGTQMK